MHPLVAGQGNSALGQEGIITRMVQGPPQALAHTGTKEATGFRWEAHHEETSRTTIYDKGIE